MLSKEEPAAFYGGGEASGPCGSIRRNILRRLRNICAGNSFVKELQEGIKARLGNSGDSQELAIARKECWWCIGRLNEDS